MDVKKAIAPNSKIKIIGIRAGEKLHEELITSSESSTVYEIGKYYLNLANLSKKNIDRYVRNFKAKKVKADFKYNSFNNKDYLNIKDLKKLINNFEKKNK